MATLLTEVTLHAGGPGSGRHSEGGVTKQDLKKLREYRNAFIKTGGSKRHGEFSDHLRKLDPVLHSRLSDRQRSGIIEAGGPGSGCNPDVGRCGRHSLQEGDKAKLLVKMPSHVTKHPWPKGTEVKILNVLPKVGTNPQMVSIKYPSGHTDHVELRQLKLSKAAIDKVPEKNIRKDLIKQQTKTGTGAKYTTLKPVTRGRPVGTGGKYEKQDKHGMSGRFYPMPLKNGFATDITPFSLSKMAPDTAKSAAIFDAERTKAWTSQAKSGEGTTIIVTRDFENKSMKVVEYSRGEHGYLRSMETKTMYFKNLGRGAAYLKERYGVSLKLPKGKKG